MKDLFNNTAIDTVQTMDRRELETLRNRFENASRVDRFQVKKMLNEIMVTAHEATDNSTTMSTRIPRDLVTMLTSSAEIYNTTRASLLRDAVLFYVKNELPHRPTPHRPEDEDISLCE